MKVFTIINNKGACSSLIISIYFTIKYKFALKKRADLRPFTPITYLISFNTL